MILMGDSDARMWVPPLVEIAKQFSLTFSVAVADACPWQLGLYYPNSSAECRTRQADWYDRVVPKLDPDIVIVADRALDDPVFDPHSLTPKHYTDRTSREAALEDVTMKSIDRLAAPGRKIVLFEPTPLSALSDDPLDCLSTGNPARSACTRRIVSRHRSSSGCGRSRRGPTSGRSISTTWPARGFRAATPSSATSS